MEKSLKDQALEAAEAANVVEEAPPVDSQETDKQDGSSSDQPENNISPEENKEETKPEQKEESKPTILEIDGEVVDPEVIKRWREDSQNKENWQKDLTKKAQEVSEVRSTLDEIKKIFVKEEKSQELTPEEQSFREQADTLFKDPYVQNLIQSEINKGIEEKTKAEAQQKIEEEKKKFQENLINDVKTLEKDLDGSDGRPKYSDSEVLEWQKQNNKLYLHPKEAYELKYKNELIEWEVQKRLKNKGGDAPKPANSNAPAEKKIEGEKTSLPGDKFTRAKAMLETLQTLSKEE